MNAWLINVLVKPGKQNALIVQKPLLPYQCDWVSCDLSAAVSHQSPRHNNNNDNNDNDNNDNNDNNNNDNKNKNNNNNNNNTNNNNIFLFLYCALSMK